MTEAPKIVAAEASDSMPEANHRRLWPRLRSRPDFWIPAVVLVVMLLIAVLPAGFASLFGHGDPRVCDLARSGSGPTNGHPFGFDTQGCDVYANVIYGARTSITIGVATTLIILVVAIVFGTLGGYFGGWIDVILVRLTDVFLGFPFILGGIIVLTSVTERSVWIVSAVLALFGWPTLARLVRSSVRSIRGAEYVLTAKTMGLSTGRIVFRYVLPNALEPALIVATLTIGGVIAAEATLSYLGIGLYAPSISWGLQLQAASSRFAESPHLLVFPSAFLAATVLSVTVLGNTLRTVFDPRNYN